MLQRYRVIFRDTELELRDTEFLGKVRKIWKFMGLFYNNPQSLYESGALAAVGVQVLSKELMNKLKNKIVIDINLVPPYGID